MASLQEVTENYDIAELKSILEDYVKETGSQKAKEILSDFDAHISDFKKIVPNDYQRMLTAIGKYEEQGIDHESAVLEAFKELSK
jgi:glutamate synthase (ferredoxin)